MLGHHRVYTAVLATGLAFSFLYIFSLWPSFELPSARTGLGRLFGLLGGLTSLATCGSYAWQRRRAYPTSEQDTWHFGLGGLALWFIILHASFRFGSLIAVLALLTLIGSVASGIAVAFYSHKLAQLAVPAGIATAGDVAARRYQRLRQRWLTVHIAAVGALVAFSLVHVLTVLYY